MELSSEAPQAPEFAQGFLPTKDGTENNCLATRLIAEEVTERLNRVAAKHLFDCHLHLFKSTVFQNLRYHLNTRDKSQLTSHNFVLELC